MDVFLVHVNEKNNQAGKWKNNLKKKTLKNNQKSENITK